MSKPAMNRSSVAEKVRRAKAKRRLEILRTAYREGKKVLDVKDESAIVKLAVVRKLMAKYGRSESTIRKWGLFRDSYTKQQFEKLCKLKRPDGLPLHWGHVVPLLTVVKKRAGIQRNAAKNGWSERELYAAIKAIKKKSEQNYKPRGGGRKRNEPADPAGRLAARLTNAIVAIRLCQAATKRLPGLSASQARRLHGRVKSLQDKLDQIRRRVRAAAGG